MANLEPSDKVALPKLFKVLFVPQLNNCSHLNKNNENK